MSFLIKYKYMHRFQYVILEFSMEKLNDIDTNRRLIAFEAYDVLSDPFWREMYDKYGDIAMKKGLLINNKCSVKKMKRYMYHGDIFLTYK